MVRYLKLRETAIAIATAMIVMGAFAVMGNSAILRSLETASFDLRFRLRGAASHDPAIAIVLIDDRSLSRLGRWPLSRHLYAQAVSRLKAAGAKVIAFDILFPEAEHQPAGSDPDREFATSIAAAGNVLLPMGFDFQRTVDEPSSVAKSAYARFDKSDVPPEFPLRPTAIVPPVEPLASAAKGLGEVELAFDLDGSPRYDYAAVPFGADFIPALPVRAAASYLGVPWTDVSLQLGRGVGIGPLQLPTDPGMRYLINYRGPRGTFDTYSFADLIGGRLPASAFSGRIVLIGGSFLGNPDAYAAPFGNTPVPGTERIANAISTILHRDFILDLGASGWSLAIMAGVLVIAGLIGFVVAVIPTAAALPASMVPLFAWYGLAQWAFDRGAWLPLVSPLTALAAAAALPVAYRYWVADRKGRQIRSIFSQYMAPEMVNILAEHPERLHLGGETRMMTIMFADIRGFTSISEQYKHDPQALTQLINRFLTPMTDIIMARRGTIDKYIGDCVMAFWNAPLDDGAHAQHACKSALAMAAALDRLNDELAREAAMATRAFTPLKMGIGINSGECVVGNMGSERRFDYSVLGDAVNLASRLEAQTKTYDVDIILGETTRSHLPGWAALELDLVAVKGKTEPARIYALMGGPDVAAGPHYRSLAECHAQMLTHYRARDWDLAALSLARCRSLAPASATLYNLYEHRIASFRACPPDPAWTGVFIAASK